MLVQVTAANQFFRVTDSTRRWADVISGNGAHFLSAAGNRYNANGQKSVYAGDTLEAALAEAAFYAALEWQERVANSWVTWANGAPAIFSTPQKLWCFRLTAPAAVIDVDNQNSQVAFHHHRLILRNPSRTYLSTQQLANAVISIPPPNAVDGLKAPAVRCRPQYNGKSHSNFLFVIRGQQLPANKVDDWDLNIEFLPIGGGPVSSATERIDWENPVFSFANANHVPAGLAAAFSMPICFT